MEFFNVVEIEDCPTTSLKVVGRYFRADTINLSIGVAKIATMSQKVYKVGEVESKKVKNQGK
jgi:hypothetical protein